MNTTNKPCVDQQKAQIINKTAVEELVEKEIDKLKGWSCETGEFSSEWVFSSEDVREMGESLYTQAHQQGEQDGVERCIALIDESIKDGEDTILAIQNGTKRKIIDNLEALQQPEPLVGKDN